MKDIKIQQIIGIIIGTAIYSFGFVHFNMLNKLGEGGFSGISLILYFTFNLDPAITNIVLNIPIFILGWKLLGRKEFFYSILGILSVSVFLKIFQAYQFPLDLKNDLLLASLFAGYSSASVWESFSDVAVLPEESISLPVLPTNMLAGAWEKRCSCSIHLYLSPHGSLF